MAKLTPVHISGVYDEIAKMRVELSPDPNKGLQYVKERLTLCRAMQDRLNELMLQCNRAYSDVLAEELTLKMEYRLSPTTMLEQRIESVGGEKADHKLLIQMLKLQNQLLSRTSMDVRLLADLTKEQLKLGEINPHEGGLVKEQTVADLVPEPEAEAPEEAQADPLIPVTFADRSARMDDDTATAGDGSSGSPINFDDLFGDLHHGKTSSRVC